MGIRPEELRIGNWIEDEHGKPGYLMNWVSKNKVQVKMEYSKRITMLDDFDPIELTEQWLKDSGFRKWKNAKNWSLGKIIIYWAARKESFCYGKSNLDCRIKYVHSLQNLYYALTGEELKKRPVKTA